MLRAKIFRTRWLALGVAAAVGMFVWVPVEAAQEQAQEKTGSLIGYIYFVDESVPARDGVAKLIPVANAFVKIKNMETGKEYISAPTDKDGVYRIEDIEEGRYALGVTTNVGDFNFGYEVFVMAGEVGKLSLRLSREKEEVAAVPFFKKPVGIAVVVAASGLAIYGTYKLLEELGVISPNKK